MYQTIFEHVSTYPEILFHQVQNFLIVDQKSWLCLNTIRNSLCVQHCSKLHISIKHINTWECKNSTKYLNVSFEQFEFGHFCSCKTWLVQSTLKVYVRSHTNFLEQLIRWLPSESRSQIGTSYADTAKSQMLCGVKLGYSFSHFASQCLGDHFAFCMCVPLDII